MVPSDCSSPSGKRLAVRSEQRLASRGKKRQYEAGTCFEDVEIAHVEGRRLFTFARVDFVSLQSKLGVCVLWWYAIPGGEHTQ
jgi:hypothetical protein